MATQRSAHPIQTRILKELRELQVKEKLNPKDVLNQEWNCQNDLIGQTHCSPKLKKQAVEDVLVEYHDIFASHRMDIGMNTEFKVRLTPKDDKAVYSQSLPMPFHLKEDSIVELDLMHKYGSSHCYLSQNTQVPYLHSGNPTENYVSLWISGKEHTDTGWLH